MHGNPLPTVRQPAVAGRFYPSDPEVLAALVDGMLAAIDVPDGDELASAYVVPHAGLRYSGPTAARVYARLRRHASRIDRVVLLGPPHYVRFEGCAVSVAGLWRTPLGDMAVDTALADRLAHDTEATADDRPHAPEHALEVQLPFLQRTVPRARILPVAIGQSSVDDVAVLLDAAVTSPGTVVLCSTDLSHYLDDGSARVRDTHTAQAVLDRAPERISRRDACGAYALRGLLGWARRHGLRPELLHLCTSADTSGDRSRVVGYSAFALRPAARPDPPA